MLKLAELNRLDANEFTRVIGPVFEHSPIFAERTSAERPFASREALHAALCAAVTRASDDEKLALIRAHPDLVGRATLTEESQGEQASAGLTDLTPGELAQFCEYNARYRERFGFPFVICARLNKKQAILHAFPQRLRNSPEEEMETAVNEIFKIAELRLRDIVTE
ncbi:MAG TPA: 2-oxo-4-hydroxy-4-carboxy-5-ureidoimidazoline decarboxylase [Chthoniobacterales bacterium]